MNELYKYNVYVAKNEYETYYHVCVNCDDIHEFFGVIDFNSSNMEITYSNYGFNNKNEYTFVGYVIHESVYIAYNDFNTDVNNKFLNLFNKVRELLLENTPEVLL